VAWAGRFGALRGKSCHVSQFRGYALLGTYGRYTSCVDRMQPFRGTPVLSEETSLRPRVEERGDKHFENDGKVDTHLGHEICKNPYGILIRKDDRHSAITITRAWKGDQLTQLPHVPYF
jgi:hypothetical protein